MTIMETTANLELADQKLSDVESINQKLESHHLIVSGVNGDKIYAAPDKPTFDPAQLKEIAQNLADSIGARVEYSKNLDMKTTDTESDKSLPTDASGSSDPRYDFRKVSGIKEAIAGLANLQEPEKAELKQKIEAALAAKLRFPEKTASAGFLTQAVNIMRTEKISYGDKEIPLTAKELSMIDKAIRDELKLRKKMYQPSSASTENSTPKLASENFAFAKLLYQENDQTFELLLFPTQDLADSAAHRK